MTVNMKIAIPFIAVVLCTYFAATMGASSSEDKFLIGIIRDQAPMQMLNENCKEGSVGEANCTNGRCYGFYNTDFQPDPYDGSVREIVGKVCNKDNINSCGKINATDRTPILKATGSYPNPSKGGVYNKDSFYTWFHDSPVTRKINFTLTLTQDSESSNVAYSNSFFFPLDGKGWKDQCKDNQGNFHNFAFCMEAHTRFGFSGKEKFAFTGDDDVWVYINDHLVIDLGGIHSAQDASVDLSNKDFARALGLQKDKNYKLDFFYCERHTQASNCKITTNMDVYCAYSDWCGICEGNGLSCCSNDIINRYCNDNDACTVDTCSGTESPLKDAVAGCTHTPVVCTQPADKCKVAKCDKVKGCEISDIVCKSNDPCEIGRCTNGDCSYTKNTCDDNNKCTADACIASTGACRNTNTTANCVESDKCYNYFCDPVNGCGKSKIVCDDNNACTENICNPAKGCEYPAKNCSDGNACTTDTCDRVTGCQNTLIACSTADKCKNATCDPAIGCVFANRTCAPGDACTLQTCTPTGGCGLVDVVCNDGNACTNDGCSISAKGCVFTNKTCSDNNKCTHDMCDVRTGCYNPIIQCNDGNACTEDSCNIATGCVFTNKTCTDNNACTLDQCDKDVGCIYPPKNCDDGDPCTIDTCDASTGCKHEPVANCANCDKAACTTVDLCFPKRCSENGGCINGTTVSCFDNNACTRDVCNNGACSNPRIECTPSVDKCVTVTCNPEVGCVYSNKTCDDNNPCTVDSCNNGECSNIQSPGHCLSCGTSACKWEDPCNPYTCNQTTSTCTLATVTCDDSNFCTDDKCVASVDKLSYTCTFPAKVNPCPSNDSCNPYVCDPLNKCVLAPVLCDDGNLCTNDTCVVNSTTNAASCKFTAYECASPDLCHPTTCVAGQCVTRSVNCDDNNLCTADNCSVVNGTAKCTNTLLPCSDPCYPAACTPRTGECVVTKTNTTCNDNNPCTKDEIVCNGDGTSSCVTTTIDGFCDDADACTNDFCNSTSGAVGKEACYHSNITCTPPTICQVVVGCDRVNGCVYAPRSCNVENADWCQIGACDPVGGCIFERRICPETEDDNCFRSVCNSGTRSCEVQRRPNFSTAKSNGGIICPLLYDQTAKTAAIGAGAAVGIAIGGAVALGFVGFGSKKAYDWYTTSNSGIGTVESNPIYEQDDRVGENPIYNRGSMQL